MDKEKVLESLREAREYICYDVTSTLDPVYKAGFCKCPEDSSCKALWAAIRAVQLFSSEELTELAKYGRTYKSEIGGTEDGTIREFIPRFSDFAMATDILR
jgi:hypothetical protein